MPCPEADTQLKKDLGSHMLFGTLQSPLVVVCLGLVQFLGLVSAGAVRWSEGSSLERAFRRAFLACLGLVGLSPIAALGAGGGCWIGAGATLAVMAVTATCDFGRSRGATDW